MKDELFVVDMVLTAADALNNGDFQEVHFIRSILVNFHFDTFKWMCLFDLFPCMIKQYNRDFNYHDLYRTLRFLVKKTYWKNGTFDYVAPLCIE